MPVYTGPATFPSPYLTPGGTPLADLTLTATANPDRWAAATLPARWAVAASPSRWRATVGADVPRLIRASVGDRAYATATIRDVNGTDLTGVEFAISLGTATAPGVWSTPDEIDTPNASTRVVKLIVGANGTVNPPAGTYWLWVQATAAPEVESVLCPNLTVQIA